MYKPYNFGGGTLERIVKHTIVPDCDLDKTECYSSSEAISRYLFVGHSLWSHLYKREMFNNVRVPENMVGEDLSVVIPLYSNAQKIIKINKFKYNYRDNENSVTHSEYGERNYNLLPEMERQLSVYPQYKTEIYKFIMQRSLSAINSVLLNDNKKEFEPKIRKIIKKHFHSAIKCNCISSNLQLRIHLYLYLRPLYILILKQIRK